MEFPRIAGFFNWNANNYAYTDYRKYTTLLRRGYSKLPDIPALARLNIPNSLWVHKEWIIGGAAIVVALIAIHRYRKNRPQYPIVRMQSTLDIAALSIAIPETKVKPPNVTLTFCIDTSSSMREEGREEAVKKGVNDVLTSAQKVVNALEGAKIEIAIVGFSSKPTTISNPTKIIRTTDGKMRSVEEIRTKLDSYRSSGTTDILAGLKLATTNLERMAKRNKDGVHALILLTDGEDTLDQKKIVPIHTRLAAARAQLFAIGIGACHKKETLRQIAPTTGKFRGTYIDTTLGIETIESAISKIYGQAIAVFRNLVLRSPQLGVGTWSVLDNARSLTAGESGCELGPLSGEKKRVHFIKIHGEKLPSPLDLSRVRFDLTFEDPRGRKGKLSLPWRPNTIIDPEIVSKAFLVS